MATKSETSYAKLVLLSANIIFAIIGFVYLIMNALIEHKFNTTTYITLAIFGLLLIIFGYLGFFSKLSKDDFMSIIIAACLLVIFIAEMSIGLSETQVDDRKSYVQEMITKYSTNRNVQRDYDNLQIENECCGVTGPEDWINQNLSIPHSCCIKEKTRNKMYNICNLNSSRLHRVGCLEKMKRSKLIIDNTNNTMNSTMGKDIYNLHDSRPPRPNRPGPKSSTERIARVNNRNASNDSDDFNYVTDETSTEASNDTAYDIYDTDNYNGTNDDTYDYRDVVEPYDNDVNNNTDTNTDTSAENKERRYYSGGGGGGGGGGRISAALIASLLG